jgi:GNAT superfamily N-acetyltransferase
MIAVASAEDAPRAAALVRACLPDRVVTPEGVRYQMETSLPEDRLVHWKAEVGGELVGWAFGGLDAFAPGRTTGFGGIVVDPAHRRAGIGSALWESLSAHLQGIGARRIVAVSEADGQTRAFVERCGFALGATHTMSAVDPRSLGQPPTPPQGIGLAPMSRFEDAPERVYASDRESAVDEPGPFDFSGMTYETWRRLIWDYPGNDRELGMVALVGDAVVGTTFLYSDRDAGRAANAGTGVLRAHRGRGIGLLMKQHSLARAAAAGIERVVTQNDETNAPMLAINERLGYERCSAGHAWVLER